MYSFSKAVAAMRSSEIRDLMKLATSPGVISFAGGMPNNDLFPVKTIDGIYNSLPDDIKKVGFQYGPTSGYPPLLASLKEYLRKKGMPVDTNELMITTGSLQAINILTQEFVDPGDVVITENPSFIGAISVFKAYRADIHSIPIDKDGIDIELLKQKLDSLEVTPKILYVTPNFHNPAGISYTKERKQQLLDVLAGRGIILLEDDAYSELYFGDADKESIVPMKNSEPADVPIVYTGSFSKIMGPGFRLGWLLVAPEIYQKCELIKQAMDACSPNFTQVLANEFLRRERFQEYLAYLRKEYASRRDMMLKSLKRHMPEEVTWNEPKGGFYFWFTMPENIDATAVLEKSIKNGAVFVTGKTFDPAGVKNNNFRMSFSNMNKADIDKGVKIIADAIREVMTERVKNGHLEGVG